jgi:hypothetical protein
LDWRRFIFLLSLQTFFSYYIEKLIWWFTCANFKIVFVEFFILERDFFLLKKIVRIFFLKFNWFRGWWGLSKIIFIFIENFRFDYRGRFRIYFSWTWFFLLEIIIFFLFCIHRTHQKFIICFSFIWIWIELNQV